MKKRVMPIAVVVIIIVFMSAIKCFAADWKKDSTGWKYLNEDGSSVSSTWVEYNGKWYYLGADGYMLTNTIAPDGNYVDENGAWLGSKIPSISAPQPASTLIEYCKNKYNSSPDQFEGWYYDTGNGNYIEVFKSTTTGLYMATIYYGNGIGGGLFGSGYPLKTGEDKTVFEDRSNISHGVINQAFYWYVEPNTGIGVFEIADKTGNLPSHYYYRK